MQPRTYFDLNYWTFIHLINTFPEEYLNNKGRILREIVVRGGKITSIKKVGLLLHKQHHRASLVCKQIEQKGHIKIQDNGNKKIICFDDEVMDNLTKMIKDVVAYEF